MRSVVLWDSVADDIEGSMSSARVLVCTPCAGEMVTTTYLATVLKLAQHRWAGGRDVLLSYACLSIADIYKARNYFAGLFLSKPALTHLLFIDADMGFEPSLVDKMIAFDRDFVSALCPQRNLKPARFHTVARQIDDPARAERLALDYVSAEALIGDRDADDNPIFRVENGFVRIGTIGAGVMLLKRTVFETLQRTYPDLSTVPNQLPYSRMGLTESVHQCFAPLQEANGSFLSEDKSFCRRWTDAGGEIWACIDEEVTHVGMKTFTGAYIERMQAGLFQTSSGL